MRRVAPHSCAPIIGQTIRFGQEYPMRLVCPILCLCLYLGGCSWLGLDTPGAPPPVQADLLRPGDSLRITVAGEEELSGAFPVNSDGTIRMELLGAVPAAGLSLAALEAQLRQRLATGYLKNPQVRVERLALTPPVLRPSQ
jgi:protein involved in polysaccharide export with SLBB domain